MSRPRLFTAIIAFLMLGPLTLALPVRGEETAGEPEQEREESAPSNVADTINRIMQDNEAMLEGQGFSYDPAGRRDPFRSLVEALAVGRTGPRPRGIAGMLISEVDLVGIVQKGRQALAFFNGSDNKGYFMRVGDSLYDGKITRISRKTGIVVFRQEVNDPRSIKPYRDVTKRLTTAEEDTL
jgi:Tfp pilus assembly protein PilP